MSFLRYVIAVAGALFLSTNAFSSSFKGGKTISVATYNAENLFDEKHDEGKRDWTYLPLSEKKRSEEIRKYCERLRNSYYRKNCLTLDWNKKTLHKKLFQLAKVIKIMDRGRSPDILVLQEVENYRVLKMLRDVALSKEGYREVVLLEGPDKRGIDIGILSKYPLASRPVLHQVDLSEHFPGRADVPKTRPVLDATFKVRGNKLRILGNHWPSQSHDDETREIAARTVYKVAKNSKSPTIVTGDFNTHPSDKPHGINTWFHNRGRSAFFFDAEKEKYREDYITLFAKERGTHHYKGKWSSLDKIFVLEDSFRSNCRSWFGACLTPDWDSFKIIKKDFMIHDVTYMESEEQGEVTYYGVPKRFDASTGEGFSDHLPVVLRLKVK